jgi:hypothetical protein
MIPWNTAIGWTGMTFGVAICMAYGLWALSRGDEIDATERQRLVHLAGMAAIVLGIINLLYAESDLALGVLPDALGTVGRACMMTGGVLMPVAFLLGAWRRGLRFLLPLAALCVLAAVAIQAWAWLHVTTMWQ